MAKNIRIIPESGSIILMQNGASEAQSVQLKVSGSDPSGSVSVTSNNGTEIFLINNTLASNPVVQFTNGGLVLQTANPFSITTPYNGQMVFDIADGKVWHFWDGMWLDRSGTSGTSGSSGSSGTSGSSGSSGSSGTSGSNGTDGSSGT